MKPQVRVLVEVESAEVRPIRFTDKKTGEQRAIYAQDVFVFLGSAKYPDKLEIIHNSATDALPVGKHYADQLYLTRQGRVQLDLNKLRPVPAAAGAAA